MFKEVTYISRNTIGESIYLIKDTDFEYNVASVFGGARGSIVGALLMYRNMQLPVAKNIARMYRYYQKHGAVIDSWFDWDRIDIDLVHPDLEYGKIYYPCILNQLKMLQFSDGRI